LEELIPFDPELHNEMAIDTRVENFSGAVLGALAASTPKRRPRDDSRPPIPAGIQDEISLKKPAAEAVADHQRPRSESRGQPPAEVGDPPAQRVEKRPVERYTRITQF